MVPRRSSVLLILAAVLPAVAGIGCVSPPVETDAELSLACDVPDDLCPVLSELQAMLPSASAGVVIALVDAGVATVVFVGNQDFGEETFFEFGSITKVLTGILLAQASDEGSVRLDASVNDFLPPAARGDQWRAVTLADLATHTAGVPPHPGNFGPLRLFFAGRARNPFSGYDSEDLLVGVRRVRINSDDVQWEYSNFGYAILGDVLTRAMGGSYSSLLSDRIFEPFGMETATVDGWGGDTIATPLTRRGRPARNWTFRAFAPAGALRGTILDGLALLEASMSACSNQNFAYQSNCLAQQATGARVDAGSGMGLGWVRTERPGATAIWHNGGTGGYSTFLGFSPERARGAVALSNVGRFREIDAKLLDWILEVEE